MTQNKKEERHEEGSIHPHPNTHPHLESKEESKELKIQESRGATNNHKLNKLFFDFISSFDHVVL